MSIDHLSVRRSSTVRTAVVVEGTTAPHAPVVVENHSIAPFAPLHTADTFVRTTADAAGRFSVAVPATHEGDQLSVRSVHSVVGIRVANTAPVDGRPPVMHQQGLRLVADAGGFAFAHVQKNTVVGEPQQVVRFTNDRTNDVVDFTLDARGRLPANARLTGKAGDVFRLATTDGVHNTDFANGCGALVAPPSSTSKTSAPPALVEHAALKQQALSGPLCIDAPQPGTVKQGQIGNCWFVSAVDAIAFADPQKLRALFRENDDDTVTFTFHRYDHAARRSVTEDVTVASTVVGKGGAAVYGSTSTNERWYPLLEKAMAGFKGGYEAVVAGYPYEAFEALLGTPGKHHDFDVSSPDAVWAALNAPQQAMATWTRVQAKDLSFSNTGLVADHAYAVCGTSERNGERFVTLRNPWGSNSNAWGGNKHGIELGSNGLLELPLGTFLRFFAGLGTAAV
jgi:hypothetical protein